MQDLHFFCFCKVWDRLSYQSGGDYLFCIAVLRSIHSSIGGIALAHREVIGVLTSDKGGYKPLTSSLAQGSGSPFAKVGGGSFFSDNSFIAFF